MASKAEQLQAHHARIVAWRAEGLNTRQMAGRLKIEGLKVDHNAVYRYCKKVGIPTDPIEPKSVKPSVPVAPVAPAVPADKMISAEKASAPVAVVPVPEPTAKPDIPEPPEPAPEPWEPPTRLYAPLTFGPWWTPDLSLMQFGQGEDANHWTLQDACEGTFITGATGSGKTSGSGATLARSFLEHGFGGLVLTVKPDERKLWERYAHECGRSAQFCIVEAGGRHRINFLDYEARRPAVGMATGVIENLVTLFYTILEVYTRSQGDQAAKDFWENAGRQLLRNTLRVLEKVGCVCRWKRLACLSKPRKRLHSCQRTMESDKHFGPWLERRPPVPKAHQLSGSSPKPADIGSWSFPRWHPKPVRVW
ncbi:MAG: hypothetical protein HC888_04625 [Candidatus Competibacteraceae bacterium]|nr:hypothetical protein [Candidatus Competibacteraceae bacterium]